MPSIAAFSQFVERYGHARVKANHKEAEFNLGQWVHVQRRRYRAKKLSPERFEALDDLNFVWAVR